MRAGSQPPNPGVRVGSECPAAAAPRAAESAPGVPEALSWRPDRSAGQPPVAIVLFVAPLAAFQTAWVFEPNFGPCIAVIPL